MKTYKSFKDIDNDLRRLDLERQIAWEELKLVKEDIKEDIKEDLQPINWVRSAIKMAGKMGGFMLLKKIIK